MSFDIFLQSFQNGRAVNLPDEIISTSFLEHCLGSNLDVFILEYPDGGRSELRVGKDKPSAGLSISRPPGSIEFWRAILSVLQQTPSCLYWPGGGPVIAQTFVRNHLPVTMIQKLGAPIIVSTPEQIVAAIKNS